MLRERAQIEHEIAGKLGKWADRWTEKLTSASYPSGGSKALLHAWRESVSATKKLSELHDAAVKPMLHSVTEIEKSVLRISLFPHPQGHRAGACSDCCFRPHLPPPPLRECARCCDQLRSKARVNRGFAQIAPCAQVPQSQVPKGNARRRLQSEV